MAAKLTDAEFIARHREANRKRSERTRERRYGAGRVALTVWVAQSTKARLLALAAAENAPVAVVADRLLSAALLPAPDALPLLEPDSTDSPPVDSVLDRDAHILALHSTGISLNQISGKLATIGILTATGCPVSVSTINGVLKANGLKANGELKR